MQPATTKTRQKGLPLSGHRRIGLTSFVCLFLGAGWVSSVVLPGLQRSSDKQDTKIAGTNSGALDALSLIAGEVPSELPKSAAGTPAAPAGPAIGTAEVALVNAPVGPALQLLLGSARFSCSTDPSVTGVVTYSCAGTPKPFWEVLGRVIGAYPAPGVHVAAIWDSYRVLPRSVTPTSMREYAPQPAPSPSPVPPDEAAVTHRMVGYVALDPSDDSPLIQSALVETRIPGLVPQLRILRVGDTLQRKSSQEVARETDAAENIDVAVAVTEVTVDHVTLRGGGDKTLRVPLSDTGVPDVFGFSRTELFGRDTGASGVNNY